jgi:hypothetical protein
MVSWEFTERSVRRWSLTSQQQWGWDEIQSITFARGRFSPGKGPVLVPSSFTLRDGQVITLADLSCEQEQLAQLVQDCYVSPRLDAATRSLQAGRPVEFGPVTASEQGLRQGESFLPWYEVAEAGINESDKFSVRHADGWKAWFKGPSSAVPNSLVLLGLIHHMLASGARRPGPAEDEPGPSSSPLWEEPKLHADQLPELGEPIHEITGTDLGSVRRDLWAGVALGVGLLVLAVVLAITGVDRPQGFLVLLPAGVGVVVLLATPYYVSTLKTAFQSVRVYREGVVGLRDKEALLFPWDGIVRFWQSMTRHIQYGKEVALECTSKLERADGETLSIGGAREVDCRLVEEIARLSRGPIMRRALAQLEDGDEVDCGPVTLDRKGITINGTRWEWPSVASVNVEAGWLRAESLHGEKEACFVSEVANFHVLLDLIRRMQEEAERA